MTSALEREKRYQTERQIKELESQERKAKARVAELDAQLQEAERQAALPAWDKMSEQERGALYVQDWRRFSQLRAESKQYHAAQGK